METRLLEKLQGNIRDSRSVTKSTKIVVEKTVTNLESTNPKIE